MRSIDSDFIINNFKHTLSEDGENFSFQFENFRGKFIAYNSSITLDGSIHKFFRGGNNHDDFSRKDLISALRLVANKFKTTLDNIEFTMVEIGLNLKMSNDPKCYYKCFKSYQSNDFIDINPYAGTRQLNGVRCFACSSDIKIYNKSVDALKKLKGARSEVPSNLVRVEVRMKSTFLKRNKMSFTAKDMLNKNVFMKFFKVLDNSFNNSIKVNEYSSDDLVGLKNTTIKNYLLMVSDKYVAVKDTMRLKCGLKRENILARKVIQEVTGHVGKASYLEELDQVYNKKKKCLTR